MKKGFVLPISILAGLALIVGAYFLVQGDRVSQKADAPGGAEFSSKRLQWEWDRQRDPATNMIPENIKHRERAFVAAMSGRAGSPLFKSAADGPFNWEHRGPWNVGGRTRGVAFDVTGSDTILAGGISGGMWRSSDGGASWVRTTSPDQLIGVSSVAQDTRPGKTHIWYYGTGEGGSSASRFSFFSLYVGNGMFKSTDNGRTWSHLSVTASGTPQSPDSFDVIWRVATDPSNTEEDEVYSAIQGAIRRSSDGGETWASVIRTSGFGATPSYYTDVAVTSTGVVYATLSGDGRTRGIYRSDDGMTFTEITPENFGGYRRIVIGLAPSSTNVVYFIAETPGRGKVGKNFRGDSAFHSLWKYTYRSGDGTGEGGEWEDRSENLPEYGGSFGDFHSQGSYDLLVKVKPDDENVVFIGGTNLYRSTDGFASGDNTAWIGGYRDVTLNIGANPVIVDFAYPKHHPDQHDVVFSPTDPNILLTANDGGVYKTINCLADSIDWISLNNGYLTTQFYTVAINRDRAGDQTIVAGTQDNGTWRSNSVDSDAPWTYTGSGDGAYAAVANDGSHLVVSKQSGRIYRVDLNSEGSVISSTRVDPEGPDNDVYNFINPLVLDPNDSKALFIPVSQHIWLNRDITAIPLNNERATPIGWDSIGASLVAGGVITAVSVSDENPSHRLWYGTNSGLLYRMDDALGDEHIPVEVTSENFPVNGYVSCIAPDPENGDRAIVVFSNYNARSLFQTTDAGETWESISGNLEETPTGAGAGPSCRWLSILHRGGRTLYLVGTSAGLFSTTRLNGDETFWQQEAGETIGNTVVDMLDVRQSDGFVAVGTHGSGIYAATIGLLGVDDANRSTTALAFESVSPNPISGEGRIKWSFGGREKKSRDVRLELLDVQGRSVAVIREEKIPSGTHTETLNTRNLSQGIYFLRLEVDGESVVKSVIVRR